MRRTIQRSLCGIMVLVMLLSAVPAAFAANTWESDLLAVLHDEVPVYDGTAQEPKPVIAYQGVLLKEGRDYTLSYSNNVNSGNDALLTVTGAGTYAGCSKTVSFVILPADIGQCRMEFANAVYCGSPVEASSHSILDSQGNRLKEGKDYALIYSENAKVGEAHVRVVGLGNYTGYADCKYQITAAAGEPVSGRFYVDLSADQDLDGKEYYLEAGSRLVLVMEASPYITELNVNGKPHPYFDPDAVSINNDYDPGDYCIQYSYLDKNQQSHSVSFTIHVIRKTPAPAQKLTAGAPIRQGSRNVYLSVHAYDKTELVSDAVWSCSTPNTARVENGVGTLEQPGMAMFSVQANGLTAACGLDIKAIDISSEGRILNYDPETKTALVTWENEILTEGTDYAVTVMQVDGADVVMAEGINLFSGTLSGVFYPVTCIHSYEDATCTKPKVCTTCGETEGEALGHSWTDATCTAPKTCTVCGETEGEALKHSFENGTCSVCGEADPDFKAPAVEGVTRIFGSDRYLTAFKAANELKAQLGVEKFQNIIVASGVDFPDALAGSYLAAVKDAPILLVRGKNVGEVKDYIKANLVSGGTVYLLGGVNAVPKAMESGLEGFNVKRLGGANRYDTNLLILREAGVGGKDIIVCTGLNFADSLSASATGLPILLVKDGLYANQKEYLTANGGNFIIVGGNNAVNATVEKQLASYGSVKRLAGDTRYDTSVLVAKEFFDAPTAAVLAYAQNFPDGLSGGPLAYALNAPLILTDNNKPTAAVKYVTELGIKDGYVLGGTGLISDMVVRNCFKLTAEDQILTK